MAANNLPSKRRWAPEDYKDAPDFFKRFLTELNLFTDPVWNILSRIPINNLNREQYSFTIKAGASASDNTFLFTPQLFSGQPRCVVVGQVIVNGPTYTPVGSAVTLDWYWNGSQQIQIAAIYGLTPTTTYTITVEIS